MQLLPSLVKPLTMEGIMPLVFQHTKVLLKVIDSVNGETVADRLDDRMHAQEFIQAHEGTPARAFATSRPA